MRCDAASLRNLERTSDSEGTVRTAGESTRARHEWNVTCVRNSRREECRHRDPLRDERQLPQHVRAGT